MQTKQDFLFEVEAPFVFVGVGEVERGQWNYGHFYSRDDREPVVRRLRGSKMRTADRLMDEIAAALQFFEGFGENWNALEECLSYLDEWLPADAYALVVDEADELLIDEPEQIPAFFATVDRVGKFWAKPIIDNGRFDRDATPFHVLLHADAPDRAEVLRQGAKDAGVTIRE